MATRHGPSLPYSVVAGVTVCASGWLVASAKLLGATMAVEDPRVAATFSELLDERPSYAVIGLNAPVGFSVDAATGARACSARPACCSAPGPHDQGPAILAGGPPCSGEVDGAQIWTGSTASTIARRALRRGAIDMLPYRQRTVYEVHPETSFYQLNDDVTLCSSPGSTTGWGAPGAHRRARRGSERILDAVLDGISPGSCWPSPLLVDRTADRRAHRGPHPRQPPVGRARSAGRDRPVTTQLPADRRRGPQRRWRRASSWGRPKMAITAPIARKTP